METVAYIFTDISFLDSHGNFFFTKIGFNLLKEIALEMISKYEKNEA